MVTNAARQAACARRPAVPAGVPVLASKITAPDEPGWAVPRPRITTLIAQGTRWCPLTVLTAPAGAGKTTALALWSAAEPGPVAWVRTDDFDNRPGVFWAHVVAALRRSGAAMPVAPPVARGRDAGHVFLLWLAATLAAQDRPVTLVLDDLHLLTDPEVLDGLDYLLRNTGAGLRLVVSARRDPLRLHRYRLAGQLTQILAGDLAFTTAEAGLLLARHGITLTADALECLTRRTEGWAAALRLAALRMRTHPDPDRLVTELITDDSALTAYLVEEVLSPQPPEVRDVLLSTSILEHVSARDASELTGNEQAGRILSTLADANAFVQRAGSGWYRYHTLFAEVLRLQLSREHPDRTAPLQRRAALWYVRNGRLPDAVRHAARAGDWQLAAGIVIDQLAIGEIIAPRRGLSLAGEFGGMPHGQAWTGAAPHVVSAAVALSAGHHESSAAALDAAEGILARLPAEQEVASRLAAAMIRLAASRRTRMRLQARLVESRLSYDGGDRVRGRRSLTSALQLGEREQLRLPFALERSWIGPVLRHEPELAHAHRSLLASTSCLTQLPPQGGPDQAPSLAVETLTEREREVLRHVSRLLSTAEVASEMHITVNTLKTHLNHIYRKLEATRRGEAVRRARQLELI